MDHNLPVFQYLYMGATSNTESSMKDTLCTFFCGMIDQWEECTAIIWMQVEQNFDISNAALQSRVGSGLKVHLWNIPPVKLSWILWIDVATYLLTDSTVDVVASNN